MWGSFLLIWVFSLLTALSLVSVIYGFSSDKGWFVGIGFLVGIVSIGLLSAQCSRRQSEFTRKQVNQFLHQTWEQPYTIDTAYWDTTTVIFFSGGSQYTATLNNDSTVTVRENVVAATGKVK